MSDEWQTFFDDAMADAQMERDQTRAAWQPDVIVYAQEF